MARRATLVSRLRREYAASVLLDSGFLGEVNYVSAAVLSAMGAMGYDAVGMSYRDFLLGKEFTKAASKAHVAVVSSSELAQSLDGQVYSHKLFEAQGRKIGVASFFWPRGVPDYTPATLASRAASILGKLRAECDVVVLLSQLSLPLDKVLLGFPQMQGLADVVIGGGSQASVAEPLVVNGTTLVPTSPRGWDVGIIEVSFDKQGRPHFNVRLQRVDLAVPKDASIAELIRPALARQTKERGLASLRQVRVGPFEPASVCGKCHQAEYADWQQTAHAAAVEALRQEGKLNKDCLVCHSELYRRRGSIPTRKTPDEGVQCSTCHGAGVRHRKQEQPSDVKAGVSEATCRRCHTPEQGEFNFEEDVAKVNHTQAAPAPARIASKSGD